MKLYQSKRWAAVPSTKIQMYVECLLKDICAGPLWVTCWDTDVETHGLSSQRIYRLSGQVNHEPNHLLIYPSKKSISVTYVFSTQRKLRKSSLPWVWETRVPGEGVFLSRGWRCRSWQHSEAVWTALAKEKRCEGARHVRVRGQAGETGSFHWECVIIQPFNFPLKRFLKYLTDHVSQQIFQRQLWHFELSALLFFSEEWDREKLMTSFSYCPQTPSLFAQHTFERQIFYAWYGIGKYVILAGTG